MCGCNGKCSGELRADLGEFARVYNDALEHFEGIARALIGECRRQPVLSKELIGDGLEPLHRNAFDHRPGHARLVDPRTCRNHD